MLSRYYAADNKLEVYSSFVNTVNKYGQCTASQLISLTHRKDSPWNIAQSCGKLTIDAETIKAHHQVEELQIEA